MLSSGVDRCVLVEKSLQGGRCGQDEEVRLCQQILKILKTNMSD